MTPREFAKYLARDGHMCWHCGRSDDTLVPGHRLGRGMGGSKLRHVPSNIVTQCSEFNGLIEQDADLARWAESKGLWLRQSITPPSAQRAFHVGLSSWFLLDDHFNLTPIGPP